MTTYGRISESTLQLLEKLLILTLSGDWEADGNEVSNGTDVAASCEAPCDAEFIAMAKTLCSDLIWSARQVEKLSRCAQENIQKASGLERQRDEARATALAWENLHTSLLKLHNEQVFNLSQEIIGHKLTFDELMGELEYAEDKGEQW